VCSVHAYMREVGTLHASCIQVVFVFVYIVLAYVLCQLSSVNEKKRGEWDETRGVYHVCA